MKAVERFGVKLGVGACRTWQRVSPLFGQHCRYYPSCSQYAIDALNEFGLLRGGAKAVWRILRCNSLFAGGIEPAGMRQCEVEEK